MTTGNETRRVAGAASGPTPRRRRGEASVTETGDGVLAWKVLRQVVEYGKAWRRHAAGVSDVPEPGPFPIRTEANLAAERFEMLAWEDPWKADGPASPFWRQDGMPEGVPEPLLGLMGGAVEGLRLLGGGLVLKIEHGGAAVRIDLGNVVRFPDDGGISIRYPFGLRMPLSVRRLLDFWNVAGLPVLRNGQGREARFARSTG